MKKVLLPLLGVLLLAGCEKEKAALILSQTESALEFRTLDGKIDLCHYSEEDGTWQVISVNESSIAAHLAHGDAVDMDGDGFFAGENGCSEPDCDDTTPDPENSCYATVELNGQTWLAENLNIEVPDSWCYDNDPANCDAYGRLYTFPAAQEACALLGEGWRVPTKAEWDAMIQTYDPSWNLDQVQYNSPVPYSPLINGGASGFDVLPGGARNYNSGFQELGTKAIFWSASEAGNPDYAWYYLFNFSSGYLFRIGNFKTWGLSCRCIRD